MKGSQWRGRKVSSGEMPGPEDTVVSPVSLEKAMLSSNIGPGFVKVCTPVCICRGIGSLSASREKALPDKMFERGIQVGKTNLGPAQSGVFVDCVDFRNR